MTTKVLYPYELFCKNCDKSILYLKRLQMVGTKPAEDEVILPSGKQLRRGDSFTCNCTGAWQWAQRRRNENQD